MKLVYWYAKSLTGYHAVISKTKQGCKQDVMMVQGLSDYKEPEKRTLEYTDAFDLFRQATAPGGGRGMGGRS